MAFPPGCTVYTFATITFIRRADSDDIVPWFYPESQYTLDAVLGGSLTYLDIGSSIYPKLAIRASCLTAANRLSLIAALNTTGTLSNDRGHSGTVTLVKATPINQGDYSWLWIDLEFIFRPA